MGNALAQAGYRKKAFLMTKIDGRTKEAAKTQLEESLTRLKTDHIDLVQFHEVLRCDDPDRIFTRRSDRSVGRSKESGEAAGKYEFFKTSGHFDTTAKHADFMGEDSPLVLKLGPASG